MPMMGQTRLNDAIVFNHGSIMLVRPLTDAAEAWLKEHTDPEAMWHGDCLVVEWRYVADLVAGMREDGLQVA